MTTIAQFFTFIIYTQKNDRLKSTFETVNLRCGWWRFYATITGLHIFIENCHKNKAV